MSAVFSDYFAQAKCDLLAATVIWASVLYWRERRSDPSVLRDLFISAFVHIVLRGGPQQDTFRSYHLVLGVIVLLLSRTFSHLRTEKARPITNNGTNQKFWTRPLIFPCRTSHTRLFPKKHSFSYSYLFVGIPVGWHGRLGSILSADVSTSRGWFHVSAADYLERDLDGLDLRAKLDHYLDGQGISGEDYPYAYLMTAPRFLSYSFNPVSFWYLYSADRELKAMILEVNNTFDERRLYFLPAEPARARKNTVDADVTSTPAATEDVRPIIDEKGPAKTVKFSHEWKKDFHVSPFNSRDGIYKLIAEDPVWSSVDADSRFKNTIKLLSSEGNVKLVARVFSTAPSLDPVALTFFTSAWLVLCWGWVGFFTFPRILREAGKLYFKKKLTVWFRPEVARGSISRHPTDTEKLLETFFARHLSHRVEQASVPITLIYKPAPGTGTSRSVQMTSPTSPKNDKASNIIIEVEVHSPAFYSRLVHYAHDAETIDREFLYPDIKSQTIAITNADHFSRLLQPSDTLTERKDQIRNPPHIGIDALRWALLRRLRCPPADPAYSPKSITPKLSSPSTTHHDIRTLPLSPLDYFVKQHCTAAEATIYRGCVMELFLAQRFAFGFTAIVVLVDWTVRTVLAWVGWGAFARLAQDLRQDRDVWMDKREPTSGRFLTGLVVCNAIHFWALAKWL